MSILVDKIKYINKVVREKTSADMFLFGSTLRQMLLNGELPTPVEVVVLDTSDNARSITCPGVNFIFSTFLDYSHELYTLDNIYVKIPDNFDGTIEVQSTNNGLVDFNKNIIKLTKSGKHKVTEDPRFLLDTIILTAENKFTLDSTTTHLFLKNRHILKNYSTREVYSFFKNIVKYNHPRKIISLLNTLGVSKELFDTTLYETSVINHLRESDYYEFFWVIFSNINTDNLNTVLGNNGFSPKDVQIIKNITSAISSISGEDADDARKIIKLINGYRVPNMIKLLNAMKFKKLAANVKLQKDCVISIDQLCITEDTIKAAFKINNDTEIKKLLEKALNKVISDPEYNDTSRILSYLNTERI
jgi:hypothetical protein